LTPEVAGRCPTFRGRSVAHAMLLTRLRQLVLRVRPWRYQKRGFLSIFEMV